MVDLREFIKQYRLPEQYENVVAMMLEGQTITEIASAMNFSRSQIIHMQKFIYDYFNIEKYDTGGHKYIGLIVRIYKDYIDYLKGELQNAGVGN